MAVRDLGDCELGTFIERNRAPDALWLLLHIPKTAGSSLAAELNALRPPYRNIHLHDEHYLRTDLGGDAFWAQLDPAIDAMIADDRRARFRSASGHMTMRQALRIRSAIERTRLFTFLRDPVKRVISDYRYQRSTQHPAHREFAAAHPTIHSYIGTADRNKMFSHLSLAPREPVDEVIGRAAETFAFVGLVEMYPMSFNLLSRLFGADAMPQRHERVAPQDAGSELELTNDLLTRIGELNALDVAIYAHFVKLMRRHREDWLKLRGSGTTPDRPRIAS